MLISHVRCRGCRALLEATKLIDIDTVQSYWVECSDCDRSLVVLTTVAGDD